MRSMDVTWYHTRSVVLQRCQWRMNLYRNTMTWRCDRSKVWSLPTEWSLTANASFWLIAIHNTNMCMWALSHIYTYLICDTQTYRRTGQRSASGSNTILTLLFPHYQHQEVAGWCIFYTWWVGNLRILPLDAISLWQLSFFAPFIRLFIPKTAIFHSISIFPM